jgi:hypothetical protein
MSVCAAEIAKFVKNAIEPLTGSIYGNRYRAAAYLLDGTHLPCVVFQSKRTQIDLFLRRMKELRWKSSPKKALVASFVTGGSRIAYYDLKSVEKSPFAWPSTVLQTIHGETTMGWTAFVAEMRDGTMHSYGTDFRFEFFDLPRGYSHEDIVKIHSGMSYSPSKGLQKFSLELLKESPPLREKPFFTCYLEELD